jgi:pyruvate-formate lyase
VALMVKGCNVVDQVHADVLPSPFLSLVIQDCVARGLDVTAGGARYNFSGVQGVQIANVADSLAGGAKAVFDEKWLAAADLLDALRTNFGGQVPAPAADPPRAQVWQRRRTGRSLRGAWGDRYCALVEQHPTIRGGVYQPGFYTVSAHVPMGANVGATPDGRHAGTPLADGGLSPTAGRDRRGATAVLQSVSKLDLRLASNGTLLNMKFCPPSLRWRPRCDKFVLLLRGFCGLHMSPRAVQRGLGGDAARGAGQPGRVSLAGCARGGL